MTDRNKEWFKDWFNSPYHDILYNKRNDEEAAAFINKLMLQFNINDKDAVLDIACGDGRHARAIAPFAKEVIGIDLAENRIQKALQNKPDNVDFYVHDMRYPFHKNYFDYAFNLFTSFGYFENDRDHLSAAHAIAQSLKSGGTFILDYFNITLIRKNLVEEETIQKDGIQFDIKRKIEEHKVIKSVVISDGDNTDQFEERVTAFDQQQLVNIFSKAGLEHQNSYGNYNLSEFDADHSPRLILSFKKL